MFLTAACHSKNSSIFGVLENLSNIYCVLAKLPLTKNAQDLTRYCCGLRVV